MVAVDWGRPRLVRATGEPRGGYWGSVVNPSYVAATGSVRRPVEGSGPTLRNLLLIGEANQAADDQAASVAIHEAGHATVAAAWGVPVVSVTVQDSEGGGATRFDPSWRHVNETVRLAAIVGGQLAVEAAGLVNEDCRHDDHLAAGLESRMDTTEIARSARLADRAITADWRALCGLAAVLDAASRAGRPMLSGDQVRRVLALGDADDDTFKREACRIVMG